MCPKSTTQWNPTKIFRSRGGNDSESQFMFHESPGFHDRSGARSTIRDRDLDTSPGELLALYESLTHHLATYEHSIPFMRFYSILPLVAVVLTPTSAVQTTTERRVHHHKHAAKKEPLLSLTQLLAKSAELTKQFEKQAAALREKVQETEEADSVTDTAASEPAPSFVQLDSEKKLAPGAGLKAMESVTEEIMHFTDRMRKMGNEVSMFSSH